MDIDKTTVRSKLISQCRAILAQLESPLSKEEGADLEFFGEEYQLDSDTLDETPLF